MIAAKSADSKWRAVAKRVRSKCPLAVAVLGCYGAEMALSRSVRCSLKLNGWGARRRTLQRVLGSTTGGLWERWQVAAKSQGGSEAPLRRPGGGDSPEERSATKTV